LYVTDKGNHKIRKIAITTGIVTTLAGSGTSGSADGTGISASFSALEGITTDGANLYVVDGGRIRKIKIATGEVTTLTLVGATGGVVNLSGLGITTDGANLYVTGSTIGTGSIHKIVISTGVTTLMAGNPTATLCNDIDGVGTSASFCLPRGITTDGTNLYVVGNDSGFSTSVTKAAVVRKVVISTGQVTTLAGGGAQWDTNASGALAGFRSLMGITTDGVSLFATDADRIRKIQ
jgi:hypothetical protein